MGILSVQAFKIHDHIVMISAARFAWMIGKVTGNNKTRLPRALLNERCFNMTYRLHGHGRLRSVLPGSIHT